MINTNIYNLFPEITPYHTDHLKVDNIHEVYFEQCGNPNGTPVVFLHGGPEVVATQIKEDFSILTITESFCLTSEVVAEACRWAALRKTRHHIW